jgi:hypothetical protein
MDYSTPEIEKDRRDGLTEAAYETLFERYLNQLLQACGGQPSWPLKVKVGIGATLDMAAAAPHAAQLLAVETAAINRGFLRQMLDSRDRLARLLLDGRKERPHGVDLPRITESVLVAGVAEVISARLRAGEAKHLPAVAPELVEFILLPYLGHDAAEEVARRPRPDFEAHEADRPVTRRSRGGSG